MAFGSNDGSRKTYVTLAGEDDSMEVVALAPATYAFKLRGIHNGSCLGEFHYARTILKWLTTVGVYLPGNRQAEM